MLAVALIVIAALGLGVLVGRRSARRHTPSSR
jgi:hypothetical protein